MTFGNIFLTKKYHIHHKTRNFLAIKTYQLELVNEYPKTFEKFVRQGESNSPPVLYLTAMTPNTNVLYNQLMILQHEACASWVVSGKRKKLQIPN